MTGELLSLCIIAIIGCAILTLPIAAALPLTARNTTVILSTFHPALTTTPTAQITRGKEQYGMTPPIICLSEENCQCIDPEPPWRCFLRGVMKAVVIGLLLIAGVCVLFIIFWCACYGDKLKKKLHVKSIFMKLNTVFYGQKTTGKYSSVEQEIIQK